MKEAPKPNPQSQPYLPEAPQQNQFPDQESYEEALAGWQNRVGRIKGMILRASQTKSQSPASDQ